MERMRIEAIENDRFILISRGSYPAVCRIDNLQFSELHPVLLMGIDWICKGGYTNGQRKKMVARTMKYLLISIVSHKKQLLKLQKV